MSLVLWLIVLCGGLSIVYGVVTTRALLAADSGSARMQEISAAVREGASAYLKRQYTTIGIVGVVILIAAYFLLGIYAAIGFLIGAVLSGAAGFIGMNVSVRANVRVAQAAISSLARGLDLSFKAGAITGMLVAGLGLLGVALYFMILTGMGFDPTSRTVIDALVALSCGPDWMLGIDSSQYAGLTDHSIGAQGTTRSRFCSQTSRISTPVGASPPGTTATRSCSRGDGHSVRYALSDRTRGGR